MGGGDGGRPSLLSSLGVLFPLTPALSLGERGGRRPSLEIQAPLDLSPRGQWLSLSPRERAGVRGNRCSDKPKLNLMAVVRAGARETTLSQGLNYQNGGAGGEISDLTQMVLR
jgi:hypothetical protein